MKPFLVLQLRPEAEAADNEFDAFLDKGGLNASEVQRVRLDLEPLPADLDLSDYSGVIVGGGPGCVSDAEEKKTSVEKRIEDAVMGIMPAITERDFPYLGCCYGIGILAHHLNGTVNKAQFGEPVGPVECATTPAAAADRLLEGLPESFTAFTGHKEAVQALPDGCVHLVSSAPCPFQMIRYKTNVYATQFHPEADSNAFELRIRIYKDAGYFPPDDAETLIADCRAADVHAPERILRNFVTAYRCA